MGGNVFGDGAGEWEDTGGGTGAVSNQNGTALRRLAGAAGIGCGTELLVFHGPFYRW